MTDMKSLSGLAKQFVEHDLILAEVYAEEAARLFNLARINMESVEDECPGLATDLHGEIKLACEKSETFRDRIREIARQL